ncbi:MAG: DmsC/YnfH family molybdoenzyme membrane anchor subunit [Pseudomonadota bacterium]
MHPATSLILFTTLSGLGFGLLIFLGLGMPPVTGWVAFAFFAIAYALAVGGLLSSVFHLGHPERALKAFTQWRSSWLSREAWAASGVLSVMAVFGAGLVFAGERIAPLGWLGALGAAGTVLATSMIYAQLKTVPRWNHWSTPSLFLLHAVAGGALLAGQSAAAILLLVILGTFQLWVWSDGDVRFERSSTTLATATRLTGGALRAFEQPHTGPNYLTREMIHVVGRRHARKLRAIGLSLAVILPAAILALLPFSHALAGIAVLSHIAGSLVNRWLFFAEAEHVVGLYYGQR